MNRKINIAIDGYSSCGKGTLAKMLAKELGYLFIDSGAMYRAVTLSVLRNGIDPNNAAAVAALLPNIHISFVNHPETNYYHTFLNGEDIESDIRTMAVSSSVSAVSRLDVVRDFLVSRQKQMGEAKGVVMDGRGIGTVVFPDAELKLFMTARSEVRAMRRFKELTQKGEDQTTFEEVLENLSSRDKTDSERANSPLKPASDAIILDNSDMSREEQFMFALDHAKRLLQ